MNLWPNSRGFIQLIYREELSLRLGFLLEESKNQESCFPRDAGSTVYKNSTSFWMQQNFVIRSLSKCPHLMTEKMFKASNQEMLFEMLKLFCSPQQSGIWEIKLMTPTSKIRRTLAYWRMKIADKEPVGKNASCHLLPFQSNAHRAQAFL